MAKLISLYREDSKCLLGKRELPLPFDESIEMVMKLPELNLKSLPSGVKGSELQSFVDKCKLLTSPELRESMRVSSQEVFELIRPNVPCVGCRRSVERLFHDLVKAGQNALYPVTLSPAGNLGLTAEVVASSSMLFILLKYYGNCLSTMVESMTTKSRQTRRCPLHSLDAHRARPTGVQWRQLWDSMAQECKEEITLVEADTLLDTLEAYLQKHRFCPECRLKVLRAYSLLVGEVEPGEEKGYKPLLYLGLKCCPAEKHIHVQCNTDLISLLIARAEPELVGGSRRERHAKTMEVAQEEVVTCVGICLLERLQRLAQRVREEEQMVDMLQYATLQALHRSFELAVESKRGVSQLELFCEEFSREEAVHKQRKEAKKQKRKKKRNKNKETCKESSCLVDKDEGDDNENEADDLDDSFVVAAAMPPSLAPTVCHCSDDHVSKAKIKKNGKGRVTSNNNVEGNKFVEHKDGLNRRWESPGRSPSPFQQGKHSSRSNDIRDPPTDRKCPQESGYCSTNSSNLTTPEGSDVACTEGLCNHHSGSPVQCRPSPSPIPKGRHSPENDMHCECNVGDAGVHRTSANRTTCLVHIKLRDNCRSGRSLQEMLEEWHVNSDDDDTEESFIPLEEVQAFRKQQQHYNEQRRQLRNDLRLKFDRLCGRASTSSEAIQSQ